MEKIPTNKRHLKLNKKIKDFSRNITKIFISFFYLNAKINYRPKREIQKNYFILIIFSLINLKVNFLNQIF